MFLDIIGWTFAIIGMIGVVVIGIDTIRKGLKKETSKKICPVCLGEPYGNCEGDFDCLKDNDPSCKGCRYECETCHGTGKI